MIWAGNTVTVNRPDPVSGTPPVVTVTSRGPAVAPWAIVIFAFRLVAETSDTELTVIPAPKLAVDAAVKFVPDPVIETVSVAPCRPVEGVTDSNCCGGAALTVNKPEPVKGVPSVMTVTSRVPTVAPAAIVMFAVKLTALLNVTELIVMPLPRLTVDCAVKVVLIRRW